MQKPKGRGGRLPPAMKRLRRFLLYVGTVIVGFIASVFVFYKPDGGLKKTALDGASEAAIVLAAGCVTCVCAWMGGWTETATALAIVAVADYITGFLVACFKKSKKTKSGGLSSKVGFYGLMRKVLMFVAIIVAHQLDIVLGRTDTVFRDIVIACFIANESLSFYENLAMFGIPFPKKLKKLLDQVRDTGDDSGGTSGDGPVG